MKTLQQHIYENNFHKSEINEKLIINKNLQTDYIGILTKNLAEKYLSKYFTGEYETTNKTSILYNIKESIRNFGMVAPYKADIEKYKEIQNEFNKYKTYEFTYGDWFLGTSSHDRTSDINKFYNELRVKNKVDFKTILYYKSSGGTKYEMELLNTDYVIILNFGSYVYSYFYIAFK